jgi:DNA polymerase-1
MLKTTRQEGMMEYIDIRDYVTMLQYLASIKLHEVFAIDTESVDLRFDSPLLGISLYQDNLPPAFIHTDHFGEGVPIEEIIQSFNSLRLFKNGKPVLHNAKHDICVFDYHGFGRLTPEYDTMLATHVLDCNRLKNLEYLVNTELNYPKKKLEELLGKKWHKIDWWEERSRAVMANYSAEDAYFTIKLYHKRVAEIARLDEEGGSLHKVLKEMEFPLIQVLADAKLRGVKIDLNRIQQLEDEILPVMDKAKEEIFDEAGCVFNLNSPAQLGDVLFNKMGLPVVGQTKSGKPSTDKYAMEELEEKGYPIAIKLARYSKLDTLYSSFIKAIPALVWGDGRLRGDLNSAGTETGRFSSSNPNLQNQPNNEDFPVRSAFVAGEGRKFVVADYSQIELRMMAHCSRDEKFISAFKRGDDIHQAVADEVHCTRKQAKVVNFGILYGMGAVKLAYGIKASIDESKRIIEGYSRQYRGYYKWKISVEEFAKNNRFIETIFGRRRPLAGIRGGKQEFFKALRQAVNTVIQGSSADLMKITMIQMWREFKQNPQWDAWLLLSVHDEVVIECDEAYVTEVAECVRKCMEDTLKFEVPILADVKICDNWHDMKGGTGHAPAPSPVTESKTKVSQEFPIFIFQP